MRYIAINDDVDSAKGDNDFTPFRNLFNDFYVKNASKKVRAIKRSHVNEFVRKIVVHAPEKVNVKRFQKVDIVFNFVSEIHLPTDPQGKTNEQEKTA